MALLLKGQSSSSRDMAACNEIYLRLWCACSRLVCMAKLQIGVEAGTTPAKSSPSPFSRNSRAQPVGRMFAQAQTQQARATGALPALPARRIAGPSSSRSSVPCRNSRVQAAAAAAETVSATVRSMHAVPVHTPPECVFRA